MFEPKMGKEKCKKTKQGVLFIKLGQKLYLEFSERAWDMNLPRSDLGRQMIKHCLKEINYETKGERK